MSVGSGREIARSVLRYRGLIEFLLEMRVYAPSLDLLNYQSDFDDFLSEFGVIGIEAVGPNNRIGMTRLLLKLQNESLLRVRISPRRFDAFAVDWSEFRKLEKDTKDAVFQGVADANTFGPSMVVPLVTPDDLQFMQTSMSLTDEEKSDEVRVSGWTDERLKRLTDMWDAGLTASQIADELGNVSRNAVIGKAYRIGLKSRPSDDGNLDKFKDDDID